MSGEAANARAAAVVGLSLLGLLPTVTAVRVDAANAPQQWLDRVTHGVEESLRPVVVDHLRSQLDWRSYYLDWNTTQGRIGAPAGAGYRGAWGVTEDIPSSSDRS